MPDSDLNCLDMFCITPQNSGLFMEWNKISCYSYFGPRHACVETIIPNVFQNMFGQPKLLCENDPKGKTSIH